jgi:hypothetical protein
VDEHRRALVEYEIAEREYLQAVRDRADWSNLSSKAAEAAEKSRAWDVAAHDARREASDDSREALSLETDTTEALSALWTDIALAYEGKPPLPD